MALTQIRQDTAGRTYYLVKSRDVVYEVVV
jgi:hypothetical protein